MMTNGWGDYGTHMGTGGGILMVLFWVVLLTAVVLLIVKLTSHSSVTHASVTTPAAPGAATAVDILNKRYARGEIDQAEYDQKKKDLTS